jgi:hypothetical protein
MEERLKFVARLLDGEKMAVLWREFDISRCCPAKSIRRRHCDVEREMHRVGPLGHGFGD